MAAMAEGNTTLLSNTAKHCPAKPSTSLSPLARTSPSPWTPGEEMQRGGRSSCKGSKTIHQWHQVKWKLVPMLSLVTCASSSQPLKRGWGSTSRWSTDHPSCHQQWRLQNAQGSNQRLHPPKTAVLYLWSIRFSNAVNVTDMPVRQRVSTLNNV